MIFVFRLLQNSINYIVNAKKLIIKVKQVSVYFVLLLDLLLNKSFLQYRIKIENLTNQFIKFALFKQIESNEILSKSWKLIENPFKNKYFKVNLINFESNFLHLNAIYPITFKKAKTKIQYPKFIPNKSSQKTQVLIHKQYDIKLKMIFKRLYILSFNLKKKSR
ncbi:hypothetical protein ABPG74_017611 [Tetrahymena malaccensis]